MKAKEVLDLLKITRVTLSSYVKSGKINVKRLHNGYYDYCKEDVYELAGEEPNKINVIYSRVSTYKQKDDLDVQTDKIVKYCKSKKITVKHIFSEI